MAPSTGLDKAIWSTCLLLDDGNSYYHEIKTEIFRIYILYNNEI